MKSLGVILVILFCTFKAAWSQPTCESTSKYPDGTDCSYRGDKSIIASDGTTQYYWLDMPDGYDSDRVEQYPLIVWLHAYGEDRYDYLTDSVEFVAIARAQGWIVIAPDYRGNSWMNALARNDVTRVINSVQTEFNVDGLRVHVFGISMGGGGALTYAMYNAGTVASVAEFAGITDFTQFYYETTYENLRASVVVSFGGTPVQVPEIYSENSALGNEVYFSYTPVMLIHGNVDSVINVSHARNLYSSLLELGYDVSYSECEGIGHDKACLATVGYQSIFDFFNLHRLESSSSSSSTTTNPPTTALTTVPTTALTTVPTTALTTVPTTTPTTVPTTTPTTAPSTAIPTTSTTITVPVTLQITPESWHQSRWVSLIEFLRIEGSDSHFDRSVTEVSFTPERAAIMLPLVIDESTINCIGILMPRWVALVDSINVTVTTGAETATATMGINLLPFFLEQEKNSLRDE